MSLREHNAAARWLPACILSGLFLLGCSRQDSDEPVPANTVSSMSAAEVAGVDNSACTQLMQPLTRAIWGNDPDAIRDKFYQQVLLIEQRYDLTDSEPPYALGPARSRVLANSEQLTGLMREIAKRAGAQDGNLIPNPRPATGTDPDAAFASAAAASNLERCAITLDIGDAEHVLLAAFDQNGAVIKALYVN